MLEYKHRKMKVGLQDTPRAEVKHRELEWQPPSQGQKVVPLAVLTQADDFRSAITVGRQTPTLVKS